jgi:DNA-binding PadR family transcriptional regulator
MMHHWMRHATHRKGLRYLILASLRSSPKYGVEIMKDIETASTGWWRPSPGALYPMLSRMTTEGVIRKRDDGKYEITSQGELELGVITGFREGPSSIEGILSEMETYATYLEELKISEPAKLESMQERIRDLATRLTRVAGSQ